MNPEPNMAPLVVVSGPSGTGKTTVVDRLFKLYSAPTIDRESKMAPLIVVSGPSGVGKTTVVDRLLDAARLPMRRAVTATTRPQRGDEADGINYHFWTREKFEATRDAGEMLEWAVVYGRDYYGTPRSEVDPFRSKGIGVVLVIDVQGAAKVRETCPDCLTVFITAPSFEALETRLRGRATESEERIVRRLDTARVELTRQGEFQHVIVNDDLGRAVNDLAHVIRDRFVPGSA